MVGKPTSTLTFSGSTLTLSGSDTLAHYITALDEVQFSTTSTNSTPRTLTWTMNDQAGGQANNSAPGVTSTVDVVQPPQISGAGATATFTGGGSPVVLDSSIAVTDATSTTLASATISIVSPITGDTLNFTNNGTTEGNIAISSNAGGQLVLGSAGGTATLAQWDAALDSITYSFTPANGDPTGGGGHTAHTVDWVVNDGVASSATATSTLDTVHVAPTVTAGATATFNVGTPAGFGPLADAALTVGDVDSAGNLSGATILIANAQTGDSLAFTNQNGISGSFAGSTLTLSGTATLAQYQSALESITFNSTSTSTASRTIDWTVTDGNASHGSNVTAATSTVNITTIPLTTTETITLATDADHDGGTSPGDTVTGVVTITNTSGSAITSVQLQEALNGLTALPNTVTITPIAVNDTYNLVGNTPLTVNAANGLLANDLEFNGDPLTFGTFTSGVTGGTVSVNSDGSFTFTPTTGFSGVASFTYLTKDAAAGNSDQSATVTLNVSAPVWYVDSAAAGGGDGSFAKPFQTIGAAATAAAGDISSGVNNIIFVENAGSTYTATSGITLANGEQLLGDGSSLTSVNGNTVGLSSANPTFSVSSGNAVTLGSGNTISGINITDTGSGAGIINATNSTVGTLTLSNIHVTSASGAGISLTHGGTVTATGTNSITTGSGIALDVVNTNIGAAGLTFHDISDNGGTEGIVLNTTGSVAGLTVTGTGISAGSGGTIQGNVQGALFTSTSDLSLSNMNFTGANTGNGTVKNVNDSTFNSGADAAINMSGVSTATFTNLQLTSGEQVGINGQNVSTLSIVDSVVAGFGNAVNEGDVELWNLTGVSNFIDLIFTLPADNAVDIRNDPTSTNTLVLNIVGSTFENNVGSAFGADGLALTSLSGATLSVNISGSTFTGLKTAGIDATAEGNSTMNVNITNGGVTGGGNSFTPGTGDLGRAIGLSVQDSAKLNYNIENNIAIKGNGGPVLEIFSKDSGSAQGRIDNNADIENNGTALKGNGGPNSPGSPVFIFAEDSSTQVVDITGNTINNSGEDMNLIVNDQGAAIVDANITSNHIIMTGGNLNTNNANNGHFNDAIVLVGGANAGDTSILYVNLQNNIVSEGAASDGNVALVNENTGGPGAHFYMEGFTGGSTEATWNSRGNTPDSVLDANPGISGIPAGHNSGNVSTPTNLSTAPTLTTPAISGTATEGNVLSATAAGGDVKTTTITYQWQENFGSGYVNIAGATTQSYTLTEADVGATLRIVATSTDQRRQRGHLNQHRHCNGWRSPDADVAEHHRHHRGRPDSHRIHSDNRQCRRHHHLPVAERRREHFRRRRPDLPAHRGQPRRHHRRGCDRDRSAWRQRLRDQPRGQCGHRIHGAEPADDIGRHAAGWSGSHHRLQGHGQQPDQSADRQSRQHRYRLLQRRHRQH